MPEKIDTDCDDRTKTEFYELAQSRYVDFLKTGEGIELREMLSWLEDIAAGKTVSPPKPKKVSLERTDDQGAYEDFP